MIVWNHKNINLDNLKIQFLSGKSTLKDLAIEYNCSSVTIKRKLRSIGVDTSLYNHSKLAQQRHVEKVCAKTKILTEDFLIRKLIKENLDTKTLSEQIGIHYSVIRSKAQLFGIKKSKDQLVGSWQSRYKEKNGYLHPSQDPQHSFKYWKSLNKVKYVSKSLNEYFFKSIMELSYALFLEHNNLKWEYESVRVPYTHHFSGKNRIYIIDFITENEWIEVKPNERMIPNDKRLYASRVAEKYDKIFRGVTKEELDKSWSLIISGYRSEYYEFIRKMPRKDRKQITYYFKDKKEMNKFQIDGFRSHHRKKIALQIYKLVLRRDNAS